MTISVHPECCGQHLVASAEPKLIAIELQLLQDKLEDLRDLTMLVPWSGEVCDAIKKAEMFVEVARMKLRELEAENG